MRPLVVPRRQRAKPRIWGRSPRDMRNASIGGRPFYWLISARSLLALATDGIRPVCQWVRARQQSPQDGDDVMTGSALVDDLISQRLMTELAAAGWPNGPVWGDRTLVVGRFESGSGCSDLSRGRPAPTDRRGVWRPLRPGSTTDTHQGEPPCHRTSLR